MDFTVSGWSLLASLPFTALAVLSPTPTVFWPAMFVTLLLLFINIGPLNAAMANVLPAELRSRGFAVTPRSCICSETRSRPGSSASPPTGSG